MAPLELEGGNLGQKHKHYNKLVREAVSQQATELSLSDDDDVQNLVKIDVVCRTRNVEALLEVLKSEDLLYVSRAIKNSKWLITDKEYAHIVNPEYLHIRLAPEMTTKAYNKLLLSVRLNLKEAERVESFYKHIASRNTKAAYKWLQHCSIPFIEQELKTVGNNMPSHLLLRLVERSITIFKTYMSTDNYSRYELAKKCTFLANYDTEQYLDALESNGNDERYGIKYTSKITELFMTRCPNRILDKFEFYAGSLHLPTFVKYLTKHEDIEKFLLKHARNEKMNWFYTYHYMEPFVKHMSKDAKFKFVKKIFIDKEIDDTHNHGLQDVGNSCIKPMAFKISQGNCNRSNQNVYQWYKMAPFEVAFIELKKLIRLETTPVVRLNILQVLLSCAGRNMKHLRTILTYFHQKHNNEPFKFKIQFVNTLIYKQDTHEFDDETWELLNQLFQSLEVYIESEHNVQMCVHSIIVHHIIRGETVPDIIKDKFVFDNMKQYRNRLKTQEQRDALFSYLYDSLVATYEEQTLANVSELAKAVELCNSLLDLLIVWEKELCDYPYVLNQIKRLNKVKYENSWHTPIDSLYNVRKSWKKNLFEESILLSPTPQACINALKHDSALLMRHKTKVNEILTSDGQMLTALLRKVRIYWPNSLADEWKTLYRQCLEESMGNKAVIIGLFSLLNQSQLNDVSKKYAPTESKIDWNKIDEQTFNIQKQIAKKLSKARPLCPLENVLLYAKGDYLQFAVPSINSVLSHLSSNKIRQYVPRLLDTPISLQKFGVRYAFEKLNSQELKLLFDQVWKSTKNSTIRTVLLIQTHALLRKEKNTDSTNDVWELFNVCLDNLSTEENQIVYKTLGKSLGAGHVLRYKYFKKIYTFLQSLPAKADCNKILRDMEYEATEIMEFLDSDFVANVMFKDVYKNISTEGIDSSRLIASYMLSCKDEETADQRYELFFAPLLDRCLPLWDHVHDGNYRIQSNIIEIITQCLYHMDDFCLKKNFNIRVETYEKILFKLQTALSPQKDYVFLTTLKLAVVFVKLVNANKSILNSLIAQNLDNWHSEKVSASFAELHLKIAPEFAKYCVDLLKEDLDRFYPSTYVLFAKAIKYLFANCFSYMAFQNPDKMEYLKCILLCSKDKEVYLVVFKVLKSVLRYISSDEEIKKGKDLYKILSSHPSEELKMHLHELFKDKAILQS